MTQIQTSIERRPDVNVVDILRINMYLERKILGCWFTLLFFTSMSWQLSRLDEF